MDTRPLTAVPDEPVVDAAVTRLVRATEAFIAAGVNGHRATALKAMVEASIPLTRHADVSRAERNLVRYLQDLRDGAVTDDDPAGMVAFLALAIEGTTDEGPDDPLGSWRPRDITDTASAIIDGTVERPTPSIGDITGGIVGLFYTDRVNAIYGASGNGKTWIAVLIAKQVLEAGGTVWWIDFEDDDIGAADRFLDLGLELHHFRRFRYIFPSDGIGTEAMAALLALLEEEEPALVVVDSTGEWMGLHGIEGNKDGQVAAWMQLYPKPLASTGAAVILIDHVPKSSSRDSLDPIDSQRKKAAVNGSAFMVTTIAELGRDRVGKIRLTTSKDRRGHHVRGKPVAELLLDATVHPYRAELTPPTTKSDDGGPVSQLPPAARRVHAALTASDTPMTVRRIGDLVADDGATGLGLKPRTIQTALKTLEDAGLAHSPGIDPHLGGALWLAGTHPALTTEDENAF